MQPSYFFTARDHRILSTLLQTETRLARAQRALLERKLAHGVQVEPVDMPKWVATIGSRVRYRIDGSEAETDRLSASHLWNGAGTGLPLVTGRGIALVGLREGQELAFTDRSGGQRTVLLEAVCYQPEAARRELQRALL